MNFAVVFFLALLITFSAGAKEENPLLGVWESTCITWHTPQNGKTWSRVDQKVFLPDDTFTHHSVIYRGPECRGPVYYKRTARGTYTLPPSDDIRGYGYLDLLRMEEIIESYDVKLPDDRETLVVIERDIFFIFDYGRKACFGYRVFRKPRPGEDLIDQLAERPERLWTEQLYTKADSGLEGLGGLP